MTNTDQPLAILADAEVVSNLMSEIAYNRPEISSFLEDVGPDTAFAFCAWYISQLAASDPNILEEFKIALTAGIQLAGVMRAQFDKDNLGYDSKGALLILYPSSPDNEEQLSLGDDTRSSLIQ